MTREFMMLKLRNYGFEPEILYTDYGKNILFVSCKTEELFKDVKYFLKRNQFDYIVKNRTFIHLQSEVITFETYISVLLNIREYTDEVQEFLDNHLLQFKINKQNLFTLIENDKHWNSIDHFLNVWTWEDSEWLYKIGTSKNYITSEKVIRRDRDITPVEEKLAAEFISKLI